MLAVVLPTQTQREEEEAEEDNYHCSATRADEVAHPASPVCCRPHGGSCVNTSGPAACAFVFEYADNSFITGTGP